MNLSVNLSRESWHYKLQSFIWGENQPILWSLCPYFWFTVLTLVVLPFYLIGKGFGKVQDGIWYLIGPAFRFLGRTIAAFWFLHVEYPMKQTLRQETWEWLKTKDILRALVEIGMANWYGPKVGNTQPKFWGVWLDDYVVYGLMCKMHGSAKMDSYRCLSPYSHKAEELERLVLAEKVKKDWRPLWWKPFVMIT